MTIPDALQTIIAGQLRQRVPGLSMAVIKDDHVQWAQGFGLADLRSRRPADARTIYLWFSMTKIVTAHGGHAAGRPGTARPGRCRC